MAEKKRIQFLMSQKSRLAVITSSPEPQSSPSSGGGNGNGEVDKYRIGELERRMDKVEAKLDQIHTTVIESSKAKAEAFAEEPVAKLAAEVAEDEDEGEDVGDRSIVKASYRKEYRERGNPAHCGDWLAKALEDVFLVNGDGKRKNRAFDVEAFCSFLRANGVEMKGKWYDMKKTKSPGWQGRIRMCGRKKLERVVAQRGFILWPCEEGEDTKEVAPADWLTKMTGRYPPVTLGWGLDDDGSVVIREA